MLDRLACSGANERVPARPLDSRHEATANLTDTFDQRKKHVKALGWKSEDQHIPGLHFHNAGTTTNISEGTLANPIVIQDDCNVDMKLEEESYIPPEGLQEKNSNVDAVDSDMSMFDTDISSGMAHTLSSMAPKSSSSGPSNVEMTYKHHRQEKSKQSRTHSDSSVSSDSIRTTPRQADPTPATFISKLIIREDPISHSHEKKARIPTAYAVTQREGDMAALGSSRPTGGNRTGSIDGPDGDKSMEDSLCVSQRASSRSATSSSSSSTSSSSENENENAYISPAAKPSTDQHRSQCACNAHENLKSLNWKKSRSILFIKNLAQASRADDVYLYLQLNGFLSSEYALFTHSVDIYLDLTSLLIGFTTFDYIYARRVDRLPLLSFLTLRRLQKQSVQ